MMLVLGIETSCDETSAALVDDQKNILSHVVLSQLDLHKIFGGVVPEIAARNHIDCLSEVVDQCIKDSGSNYNNVDAIAVTAGPGLIGGVLVGAMFAKGLAIAVNKPIIAVNHLEAHALTARLTNDVEFPFILLLVSGGHCQILEVLGVGKYNIIGKTMDDSIGEAFDKVAKMLKISYPGGPKIEENAKYGDKDRFALPLPMIKQSLYDFSFSGLKTAVKRYVDNIDVNNEKDVNDLCASFQKTVAEILCNRLRHVFKKYSHKKLVIAGGVAANQYIKTQIANMLKDVEVISPPIKLCTDNAAMVAWAGIERYRLNLIDELDFQPRSRWPLTELLGE